MKIVLAREWLRKVCYVLLVVRFGSLYGRLSIDFHRMIIEVAHIHIAFLAPQASGYPT